MLPNLLKTTSATKPPSFLARISRAAALLFMLVSVSTASATNANVSADTSISATLPNTNFGSRSNLVVNPQSEALLRFDLSNLPTGTISSQISKATLYVFVNRVNTSGQLQLKPLDSSFLEFSATYNSSPTFGPLNTTANVSAAGTFVAFDITSLVQTWVTSPAVNFGIGLFSPAADVLLDSKENDLTGHAAYIDITLVNQGPQGQQGQQGFTGAPGPQGPTGPQGPAGPSGAVTTNYVSVYYYGGPLAVGPGQPVTYNAVGNQVGNGLTANLGTGVITANVAGLYLVSYHAGTTGQCTLLIPGINGSYQGTTTQGGEISFTEVISLTAGQGLKVESNNANCTLSSLAAANNATFSMAQIQ